MDLHGEAAKPWSASPKNRLAIVEPRPEAAFQTFPGGQGQCIRLRSVEQIPEGHIHIPFELTFLQSLLDFSLQNS